MKALSDASSHLIETGQKNYLPNYKPREFILDRGQGSRVWDRDDNEYIDLGTGISVNSLGHQHPALIKALQNQSHKIWHTSNIYFTEPPIHLAQELVAATFADRVYFCNSGAEANEAAIKLVRKYSSQHFAGNKRTIITFKGSFHGRTLATVTATAQPKYHEGFEPLPGGFRYCEFNDADALSGMMDDDVCAVMLEPVQGEGGITPAAPGFLKQVRELCNNHDALLILDEIQTGMGRTGKLFAHEWEGITPDLMTSAKALGGGLPIGAMLTTEKFAQALPYGTHGSTFGGNPVMCEVARAALHETLQPGLMDNVNKQGEVLMNALNAYNEKRKLFVDVRGKGLMIGAELKPGLKNKAGIIVENCRQQGVLILQAGPNVLRLLPPLNINDEDLAEGIERLENGLDMPLTRS